MNCKRASKSLPAFAERTIHTYALQQ